MIDNSLFAVGGVSSGLMSGSLSGLFLLVAVVSIVAFSNALYVLGTAAGVRVRGSLRRCSVGRGGDPRAGGGGQPRLERHYGRV